MTRKLRVLAYVLGFAFLGMILAGMLRGLLWEEGVLGDLVLLLVCIGGGGYLGYRQARRKPVASEPVE